LTQVQYLEAGEFCQAVPALQLVKSATRWQC
jgi:hypothetical protein